MTKEDFIKKPNRQEELNKDEFYDYSVANLEENTMAWTDDLAEALDYKKGRDLIQVWDTNENREVFV